MRDSAEFFEEKKVWPKNAKKRFFEVIEKIGHEFFLHLVSNEKFY